MLASKWCSRETATQITACDAGMSERRDLSPAILLANLAICAGCVAVFSFSVPKIAWEVYAPESRTISAISLDCVDEVKIWRA